MAEQQPAGQQAAATTTGATATTAAGARRRTYIEAVTAKEPLGVQVVASLEVKDGACLVGLEEWIAMLWGWRGVFE